MEERIRQIVQVQLTELGASEVGFAVEWPVDPAHGDFAVNAALAASKALGKQPKEIAEQLASALVSALGEDASRVEVAGPGFVNVTLSSKAVSHGLAHPQRKEEAGTKVMIEYGNPNPFKEMHIGHLVGAILGESVSRLAEAQGVQVIRDTFGGDVGPQVAKALWALRKENTTDIASANEIGRAYTHGASAYEESEQAKKEIDELNTEIYKVVARQEDPQTLSEDERALLALWQKGREVSMEEFNRLFALLGTRYDYTFFDSDTTKPGMDAVQDALGKGVFEESEGAIIYCGEKKGLHTLVFITSRGTPTYETKDIGLAFLKEMRCPTDEVIIITAVEQISHFKVTLAALEDIAPALAQKTKHVPHGLLQLTTGKMSSRKGNVITASELIASLIEEAMKRNEDPLIAEQVAIGALKYMILRSSPGSNIIFDPEKSLSLDGDSGPYLQYALVRAKSILAAATTEPAPEATFDTPPLLARLITRFPEVVARANAQRAPHLLTTYLTQLAGEWNSFYATGKIIGSADEAGKLALVNAFVITMQEGLTLLAIPVPEKM